MALISEFFASASWRRFLGERKKSRMRSMSMVGHSHEQKARPTSSTRAAMMSSDTTARGIIVLVAIMVPRAPRGQSMEMVSQPKPDMVPVLTPAIRPAESPTNTTAPTTVRTLRVFSFFASLAAVAFFAAFSAVAASCRFLLSAMTSPYASMGRTTMARSVDLMEPDDSDRHTAWQAPQPLQRSSTT